MKQTILSSLTLISLLFMASCGGGSQSEIEGMSANEGMKFIENKEADLFKCVELSGSNCDSVATVVMSLYSEFVQKHPDEERTPEFLFRSANIARSYKNYDMAINNYKTIVTKYPTYENITESHFLMAFMYDNDFKDKTEAERIYKEVAAKYKDHVFGRQAEERLKTLHLSDEELIKRFREQNEQATE